MKTLKRLLFHTLGRKTYLRLVSRLFFLSYRRGWLRGDANYEFHYFVRRLVRPGDYVVDIGANLGYYTVIFADCVGPGGRVWSVEPVPLYRQILRGNAGARANVEIVPFALGAEPGTVRMGVPGDEPQRHGLTRILSREEEKTVGKTFEAEVRPPAELFGDLPRIDYVKCDVEGYEIHVLPLMEDLLRRHRPLVQVELAGENRRPIFELFRKMDYKAYGLRGGRLFQLEGAETPVEGDVLFSPAEMVPASA